jgi:hypothetical protein
MDAILIIKNKDNNEYHSVKVIAEGNTFKIVSKL